MSLQWDQDSDYSDQPTNDTGSLYTCGQNGSNITMSGNPGNISSITIPKGTIIDNNSKTITVNLNFGDYTTFVDPTSGMKFKSISITLNYIGYVQYHPKGANGAPVMTETRNALVFSIGSIASSVTLSNGSTVPLFPGVLTTLTNAINSSASGGAFALLPTNEKHASVSVANYGNLNSSVPDEDVAVCFLAGTEIRTPEGLKNVEDIMVGDYVVIRQNDKDVQKKVIGINMTSVTASTTDCTVVCLRAHALEENIPYKDLYVTGDHCIYLDGYLVPARMLVNTKSVFIDKSKKLYDIYHIECEEHAIIYANGALTETYLNTSHKTIADSNLIKLGTKTWERDGVAPLGIKRETAEKIWNRILSRSGADFLGPLVTHDPDLHLVCKNNIVIRPHRISNGYYSFFIPAGVRNIWIKSNASRPSEAIGPFVDDRRLLGVLIDDICLFHDKGTTSVMIPFQEEKLLGWHGTENTQCRWTDGAAYLPLEYVNSTCILSLHVASFGPYLVEGTDLIKDQMSMDIALSA